MDFASLECWLGGLAICVIVGCCLWYFEDRAQRIEKERKGK